MTDEALFNTGCPGTAFRSQVFKCVDDILLAAPAPETLFKTCDEILRKLEKRNIKFSKAKIIMGRNVEYCGYVVSDKGVSPNKGRITALKHLSPPTSVKDVRSLLGALQQLNHFLPDLADVTKPISNLLMKGNEFIWGEEQKEAWLKIHSILETNLQTSIICIQEIPPFLSLGIDRSIPPTLQNRS